MQNLHEMQWLNFWKCHYLYTCSTLPKTVNANETRVNPLDLTKAQFLLCSPDQWTLHDKGLFYLIFCCWEKKNHNGILKCISYFICSLAINQNTIWSLLKRKIKLCIEMVVYFILKIRITLHPSKNDLFFNDCIVSATFSQKGWAQKFWAYLFCVFQIQLCNFLSVAFILS